MTRNRNSVAWRRWIFRAGGSAIVLFGLLVLLPTEAILQGIERISLVLFAWILMLFLLGHIVAASKWWNLLGRNFSFALAMRAHFAGLAANLCLPGVAGGDAVRATLAYTGFRDGPKIAAGSAADRLIDLLALACLSLIGFLAGEEAGEESGAILFAAGLIVLACVGAIYILPAILRFLCARVFDFPGRSVAMKITDAFVTLGRKPGLLIFNLALSLAVQLSFIALAYQLALAVGVTVPFSAWMFAWALAKVIAVLPISLGGLGVREATLAALLVPFGAVAAEVVAAGLAWQAILFITGGLGGIILAISGPGAIRPKAS